MMKDTQIIIPEIFRNYSDIVAAISTKSLNEDKESMNIFLSKLGINEHGLAIPKQIHSNNVLMVDSAGEYDECDGLFTNKKNVALVVSIADCVPIFLYSPIEKVIGVIHAGWKGTVNKIAENMLKKMAVELKIHPENIYAFIGPSAGVCCYEVSDEVAVKFDKKNVYLQGKKIFVDLKSENKQQLEESGVLSENIETSTFCTICNTELFHSYRRDGIKAGRMKAVICLT